jgi:hypothetical protein
MSAEPHDIAPPASAHQPVDNTDWLKTAAIVCVAAGHYGFFFVENDLWWSVFGRFAAPPFFFLVGYAQSRRVPLHWLWMGVVLTLLESWNANWRWVSPNILLSLAVIRVARPHVQAVLQRWGWATFAVIACALVAVAPITGNIADYGAEGWLWGLFGLCQRMYVDEKLASETSGKGGALPPPVRVTPQNIGFMRVVACVIAAVIFVWQEQREYRFPPVPFTVFVVGLGILCLGLCLFHRATSPLQPPEPIAAVLRFIGRRTFEIYAIQLAGSELIIGLIPDLAP